MKVAKEELKKSRELKQKERFVSSKQEYQKAVEDLDEEEDVVVIPKKDKKIKKKVIKYVEASSSESEEEEVIIRKKKKDKPKPPQAIEHSIPEQVTRQNLRNKLQDEQAASLARLMMPSYF